MSKKYYLAELQEDNSLKVSDEIIFSNPKEALLSAANQCIENGRIFRVVTIPEEMLRK